MLCIIGHNLDYSFRNLLVFAFLGLPEIGLFKGLVEKSSIDSVLQNLISVNQPQEIEV
jgi:hypothetical protein